ncbi:MAG: hypothetical protein AABY86_14945, partial [Bdellovibrionota bacterium]
MSQHKSIHWARCVPGILVSLCLIMNQAQSETRFSAKTCENYESDLAAVDQFLRARPITVDGDTSITKISELEEKRAKLLAQKALIEGMELLRNRHLANLAYLTNEKHCDLYKKSDDRTKCMTNPDNTDAPKKSFFEIQDAAVLSKLNERMDKARDDAKSIYGMEQTINKLLGSQSELITLLTGPNPPADGRLAESLTAKCTATPDPAIEHFCAILKGTGNTTTDAGKLPELVKVLNNFGKAFYYGHKFKKSGLSVPEQTAAKVEAEKALKSYRDLLTAPPLKDDHSLLIQANALDTFGETIKKKHLKAIDCAQRAARFGTGPGSGSTSSEINTDITNGSTGYGSSFTGNATERRGAVEQCS